MLGEGPVAGVGAPSFVDRSLWGKVGYFVHYVLAFDFEDHLAQIELAVAEAIIMSKFESLSKLYHDVVYELHVEARHIPGQVQVHLLYVRENCASIVGLNEGEVTLAL